MLMASKNLASQPFEPVPDHCIAAGFADGNAEPGQLLLIRGRI